MNKRRVLLTGHQGYIGSVMGPRLLDAGYQVTGLDTVYYGDECAFSPGQMRVANIRKDIRDLVPEDVQGFDAVIHLAALSNDPLSSLREEWTYDVNHRASVHLARLAKASQGCAASYSHRLAACTVRPTAARLTKPHPSIR